RGGCRAGGGRGAAERQTAMRRETGAGSAHRGAGPPERIARPAPVAARPLAFVADGHFSRTAFGLSRWLPAVGDDVRLRIRAEFVRARADP
ncbi:YceI family protein, partial [Burkholderia pseudomallei]